MKGPIFLSQRSPALQKMQQMTPDELREHISRMEQERARIAERLQARQKARATTAHDVPAMKLERRLGQLIDKGKELLVRRRRVM